MGEHFILLLIFTLIILLIFFISWRLFRREHPAHSQFSNRLDKFDKLDLNQNTLFTRGGWNKSEPKLSSMPDFDKGSFADLGFKSSKENNDFEDEIVAIRIRDDKPKAISDLIILTILSEPNRTFAGYELLQTLLTAGMRFGEMAIFHRYISYAEKETMLFSLASATEPGVFDMNKIGAIHCKGLTLFMRLTGPFHDQEALKLFLETADFIAEDLGGVVVDEKRQPLTESSMVIFNERISHHLTKLNMASYGSA